jgi:hypothetical protein
MQYHYILKCKHMPRGSASHIAYRYLNYIAYLLCMLCCLNIHCHCTGMPCITCKPL